MQLAEQVYELTKKFPKEELYGITSQIRRSAISVPSNIAEGSGRRSNKDFIRFLNIASGSLAELETQLTLCRNLEFITDTDLQNTPELINRVGMMITKLRHSLDDKR